MLERNSFFFLLGFYLQVIQLIFIRETASAFYGEELSSAVFLFCWLSFTGLGALFFSRFSSGAARAISRFETPAIVCLTLLNLLVFTLLRFSRWFIASASDPDVDFTRLMLLMAAFIFPSCFISGGLVPFRLILEEADSKPGTSEEAAAGCAPARRSRAYFYAAESLGFLVGGVAFTFIFSRIYSRLFIAAFVAVLLVFANLKKNRLILCGLIMPALIFALPTLSGFESRMTERTVSSLHPLAAPANDPAFRMESHVLSPLADYKLIGYKDSKVLYQDSLPIADDQNAENDEMLASFFFLEAREPRNILIIGLAYFGLAIEFARLPCESVTVVFPDRAAFDMLSPHLSRAERESIDSGRLIPVFEDGVEFANGSAHLGKFDFVLVYQHDCSNLGQARFFTREFFAKAARLLAPGGSLGFKLPFGEGYASRERQLSAASVSKALSENFPHVLTVHYDDLYFLASPRGESKPFTEDPETLSRKYETLKIAHEYFTPYRFSEMIEPFRQRRSKDLLQAASAYVSPNSMLKPDGYTYALLSRYFLRFKDHFGFIREIFISGKAALLSSLAVLGLAFLPLWLLARSAKQRRSRASLQALLLIFISPLFLICVEFYTIFLFQVSQGNLYELIGLFFGNIMLGLSAGCLLSESRSDRGMPARPKAAFAILLTLTALSTIAAPAAAGAGNLFPGFVIVSMLFCQFSVSFVCGMIFSGSAEVLQKAGGNASRLMNLAYATDLAAAAVSVPLVSLLLFPAVGTAGTVAWICVLGAALLIFLIVS